MWSKEMSKKIKRTLRGLAEDRLTPFEVAVLSRVVRADIIPEADLVFAWGMGPWAAPAQRLTQARTRQPPRGRQSVHRSGGVLEQTGSMDHSDQGRNEQDSQRAGRRLPSVGKLANVRWPPAEFPAA